MVVHELDELEDVVSDLAQVDVRFVLVQSLHPVLQLLARSFESAADEGEEPVDVVLEKSVEVGDDLLELVHVFERGLNEARDLADEELLCALPEERVEDVQVVVVRDQPPPHLRVTSSNLVFKWRVCVFVNHLGLSVVLCEGLYLLEVSKLFLR